MNNKLTTDLRPIICIVIYLLLSLSVANDCLAQCTPAPAASSATCVGTPLTANTTNITGGSSYYYDGNAGSPAFATTVFKGITYKTYTPSINSSGTLRICNGATMELSNATLGNVIVEAGATLLLSAASLSSATITNYGTIQLSPSTGTLYAINNSGNIINKGILDANGFDLRVTGKLNNYGLIIKIDDLTFNSSSSSICVSNTSILLANTIDNSNSNTGVITNGDGPGCMVATSAISGNRCLTSDATANANLKFCYGASTTLSNSACTNNGFSNAMNGVCTGGSSNCSYPLPLTLLYFKAFKNENAVAVTWSVIDQIDSDQYEILKSNNGKDWQLLGAVASYDHGSGVLQYSLTDAEPAAGLNYYKLVEVGMNGKRKEYSITSISWAMELETDFSIYPNPTEGELNIIIKGPYSFYQFEIIDLTGKILSQLTLPNGTNSLGKILTASSMYFLRLKAGANYITKKVVVK